ncbi:MAG TPA: metallophosphoesterase [Candidatus Dormibacteraeota bacterium]|nr:metallophosphoesterase [Candidatus Dormibacteraeota bacterium]
MGELPGEPHVVRTDIAAVDATRRGERIARIAHLTDLHVTDTQSPARFEFVNREAHDARFRELLTMQRPHETLNNHAIAAMVRAINDLDGLDVVAMTGDGIDNTQRNELTNMRALLEGGTVAPDSGAPGYDGVQRVDWPGDLFWKPDGAPDGDRFQHDLGFPRRPGLLEEAMAPFESKGLRVPWLRCWGNHEQVCQGVGVVTPALAEAMAGSRKPVEMPPGLDPDRAVEIFTLHPERFLTGASHAVPADPERRPIKRADLLPSSYYLHDAGRVRYVTLDTVCDAGGADGSIDAVQLRWLEERLDEARDRYVVILSHHGHDTLSNPRGERRAAELLGLLRRHPNVVLWLNGHIHANRITPRGSFWEVTTSSLVDWPCQARLVDIERQGSGHLAVTCTMLDHDGEGLAGLHRELAGNVPLNGFDSWRQGLPADRNAVLLLPDPL